MLLFYGWRRIRHAKLALSMFYPQRKSKADLSNAKNHLVWLARQRGDPQRARKDLGVDCLPVVDRYRL